MLKNAKVLNIVEEMSTVGDTRVPLADLIDSNTR